MVLGRSQREKMEVTQAGTAHFIPDHYAHLMLSTDFLTPLQNAVINRTIVKIEPPQCPGCRTHWLTFYSLNWHLMAWCHARNEYRDFRTNRIQKIQISLEPFRKHDHIRLNDDIEQVQKKILGNLLRHRRCPHGLSMHYHIGGCGGCERWTFLPPSGPSKAMLFQRLKYLFFYTHHHYRCEYYYILNKMDKPRN
jgi:WYL domain